MQATDTSEKWGEMFKQQRRQKNFQATESYKVHEDSKGQDPKRNGSQQQAPALPALERVICGETDRLSEPAHGLSPFPGLGNAERLAVSASPSSGHHRPAVRKREGHAGCATWKTHVEEGSQLRQPQCPQPQEPECPAASEWMSGLRDPREDGMNRCRVDLCDSQKHNVQ